eukprot:3757808-Prymnesium_polylepis.1
MTLNVVVDLILHWGLGLFHEALARPITKMCTQGVAGPYTHVSLNSTRRGGLLVGRARCRLAAH